MPEHRRPNPNELLDNAPSSRRRARPLTWRHGAVGAGLGLAICKGIVEAHGGAIRAENREGAVCVIAFSLAVAEPVSAARVRGLAA